MLVFEIFLNVHDYGSVGPFLNIFIKFHNCETFDPQKFFLTNLRSLARKSKNIILKNPE